MTPGTILFILLAVASVSADLAIASHAEVGHPAAARFGCLLGLLLGQLSLFTAAWLRTPRLWPRWCAAMGLGIVAASHLLASQDDVPWLHWAILLGVFSAISILLPWVYQSSAGAQPPRFSLAGLFTLTTLATLLCGAILHSDFPWQQLPLVLPGLVLWAAPALLLALTLTADNRSAPRQMTVGLTLLLVLGTGAALLIPAPWNRLPLVIAWQSLYLLLAGLVVLQARRNDAQWAGRIGRVRRHASAQ